MVSQLTGETYGLNAMELNQILGVSWCGVRPPSDFSLPPYDLGQENSPREQPVGLEPSRSLSSLVPMPLSRGLSGLNGNGEEPPKIGRLFPSSSPQFSPQQLQPTVSGGPFPPLPPQSSPSASPLAMGSMFSFNAGLPNNNFSAAANGPSPLKGEESKEEGVPRLLPFYLPITLGPEQQQQQQQLEQARQRKEAAAPRSPSRLQPPSADQEQKASFVQAAPAGMAAPRRHPQQAGELSSLSPISQTEELAARLHRAFDDTASSSSSPIAAPRSRGRGGLRRKRPRTPVAAEQQGQGRRQGQQQPSASPPPPAVKKRKLPSGAGVKVSSSGVSGPSRPKGRAVSEAVDRSQEVDPKPFWSAPYRGDTLAIMGSPEVGFFFVVTDLCRLLTNSVESRKNVSNRISDFKSPQEKVKLTVVRKNKAGRARAQKGTNCLTLAGLQRFLDEAAGTQATARGLPPVREWLSKTVLPKLEKIRATGGGRRDLYSGSDSDIDSESD